MDKLKSFKLYLLQKGMSTATITKNVACLRNLFNTLPDLKKATLDLYFISHLEKGKSKAYLNVVIVALKHWGDFVGDPQYKELKYFHIKETHKATMSDSEIERFLALPYLPQKAVNKDNYELWTLFFKVLAYSGMRPGEVANLTVESLDFGSNLFILDKTKTTPRSVPMAPALLSDLTEHVGRLNNDLIFTRKGKAFTKQMWQHYFGMRIKRLGIKRKNLSCYSLRHSFITRWAGEDINIFKIQRIVGHKRIETTANYMHLVTKDLTKAMNKDPLSRASLPLYERKKMFREMAFKLLEDLANNAEEEKELIEGLKVF
jgi:integrase